MDYQVHIEQVGERPTAIVRRRAKLVELSTVVPQACGAVWGVIREQQFKGAGRNIAVYLDDEMNLEVGVELETPFTARGEVVCSSTPAGRVATATHWGPYNKLAEAHHAIREWCDGHGHALAGPNWELYGHWMQEWNNEPAKIRTDVFYLLK